MTIKDGYIHSLLKPVQKAQADKKVWSIGLNSVWIPFFTASNINGETEIAPDALGYPMRLQYDKNTGAVRFSKQGKPVVRVAKELSDAVSMARLNFEANCLEYAKATAKDNPEAYKTHVALCQKMGTPLKEHDTNELTKILATMPKPETETKKPETDVIKQAETIIKSKGKGKGKAPAPAPETQAPAPAPETKEAVSVS